MVQISRSRDKALPLLDLPNMCVGKLKGVINDGSNKITLKKVGAYLGFRLLSYSMLPIVCNLISIIFSAIMSLFTAPFRNSRRGLSVNNWCWTHCKGSAKLFFERLVDFTCDLRQVIGALFCVNQSSRWMTI